MTADPTLFVHAVALAHLAPFLDGREWSEAKRERLLALRPHDADFPLVFRPSMEPQARALYAQLWQNAPPLLAKPGQTELRMHCATTEDFEAWNERGREFPGGYRKLAPHLQPGRVWVAWKFVAPRQSAGLSFDGVTWVDERLVWFPQPWRLVPIGP
jgi:hypothetical protein